MADRFNFDRYADDDYNNYVMHCPTEEQANIFLEHLHNIGKTWCDKTSYLDANEYRYYREDTCYAFTLGEYADLEFYNEDGAIVLEFDDFDWGRGKEYEGLEIDISEKSKIDDFLGIFSITR